MTAIKLFSLALLSSILLLACTSQSPGPAVYSKAVEAADEGFAIQALRTIATAQAQAKVMRGSYADFNALVQAGFLDQRFAATTPNLKGYRFTMSASDSEFSVNADPQTTETQPTTGSRHFYLDSSNNDIHVNATVRATKNDSVL